MSGMRSGSVYAKILNDNKILYVPSCLIVEMMARLYTRVSAINISGNVHDVVPDLLILLRRLTFNLKTTADAYQEARIRFFIGDWKQDKLRARKLFFSLMSRLGYMSETLGTVEKKLLYASIEEMTRQWVDLDEIMEDKCRRRRCSVDCDTCRYFRDENPTDWRTAMAKTILDLDARENCQPGTYLILLCYGRIKDALVKGIEELRGRTGASEKFSPDRILCASQDEVPIACPTCATAADAQRPGLTGVVRKSRPRSTVAERISLRRVASNTSACLRQNRRYLMPPSLADISYGSRR